MAAINGWQYSTPLTPSFLHLFGTHVTLPGDRTTSRSTKHTIEEELVSALALKRLGSLNLNDLCLAGFNHNLQWAQHMLAQYAPIDPRGWDLRGIDVLAPRFLDGETNVLAFLNGAYLGRALCAGWFLYSHSRHLPNSHCPSDTLFWHDTSNTGPSGRADRTLYHLMFPAVLSEGKTAKVCASRHQGAKVSVFKLLHQFSLTWTADDHREGDISTWLTLEGSWETKGRRFLLQVSY
jgi:hypothetical protein